MRRAMWIVGVFLWGLTSGCATTGVAQEGYLSRIAERERTASFDNSYSIEVPGGWSLEQNSPTHGIRLVRGDDGRGIIVIRAYEASLKPTSATLASLGESVIEELKTNGERLQVLFQSTITVQNYAAVEVAYKAEFHKAPIRGKVVVVIAQTAVFSVSAVAPRDDMALVEAAQGVILDSIRVERPPLNRQSGIDGRFSQVRAGAPEIRF